MSISVTSTSFFVVIPLKCHGLRARYCMTLLPFCDENGRDLPCGLRSYSGEPWRGIFVLVPSLIMTNVRSHSQLPYFNHTRYLLLKCDYFHIENVLQALFVSVFLVNLLEWNVLQSHATVLKQKLANKQSHYWNVLPGQKFHTRSHIKNLNVNILRRTLLRELTN